MGYGKEQKRVNIVEDWKLLKQTFFNSIRGYDIIHSSIKCDGIYTKDVLPKRSIWVKHLPNDNQYH